MGWFDGRWREPLGPLDDINVDGLTHADLTTAAIEHDTVVVASPPIWNDGLEREASTGRRLVAFTTWETDRIPDGWLKILDSFDQVLVPSRFNRDTFVAAGIAPRVSVVPHIAAPVQPPPRPARLASDPFVFYSIATWTARKAVLDTVSAFVNEFTAADDVTLVIHTTAEDHIARGRVIRGVQPWIRNRESTWFTLASALAGRADLPRIVLSTRTLDRAGIAALHAGSDCFVSLSRGEGWGLGAFDAGSHGNPVVITGWGGSLDMLPAGYPYCVDYDLTPTMLEEPDDWWSPQPGERWAKARVPHASSLLRDVFEHRVAAREWGQALQSNIHSNFDAARVTRRLLDALGQT
jgi:glycosyltransferase involved in cell wall biosynthesis